MEAGEIYFEGAATAKSVVTDNNPSQPSWLFSLDSPFWKAIKHAHQLGRRGANRTVAIIDSAFDLSETRFRDRVDAVKSFGSKTTDKDMLTHGTLVAQLINEVAPDSRLELYEVARNGKPDISATIEAMEAVIESDADVINISLGIQRELNEYADEHSPCKLCLVSSEAWARGKLVFAAAGNIPDTIWCPAQATGVVSVGFRSSESISQNIPAGGMESSTFFKRPKAPQAPKHDITLSEIPGLVGTSYATPLFSGAAALGLTQQELSGYIAGIAVSSDVQFLHALIRSGSNQCEESQEVRRLISQGYEHAQKMLPHVHCSYQSKMNPDGTLTDPHTCFSCGIFVEPVLVNHGLWLLETLHTDDAKSLLEAAYAVAPWSPDAVADLGAAVRETGDIAGAIKLYEVALQLRPGFEVYTTELERLRKRLRDGGKRWSLWTRFFKTPR